MTSSVLLSFYRAASAAARPCVPLFLLWRQRRGWEDRSRVRERMGFASLGRPDGRLVWVHAASAGDGQTLLPLFDRLGTRGFQVLVSTRSLSSAQALRKMLPAGSFHQFIPFDVPVYVRRFLDHWRPDLILLAGAETWPNVLIETRLRGLPVICVNAGLSDRLYALGRRNRRFAEALMRRVDLCLARSDEDAERFIDLGARSVQTVGDLAFDQPLPAADPLALSAFQSRVGARPIWIAAPSEPDEERLVLEAHRRLLPRYPDLVTVVIPRHRREAALAMAQAAVSQNLATGLRSRDEGTQRLPGLFIADVAGEIGLFYRAGGIVFLGRLAFHAGRGPIEPAKLGCAILHAAEADAHAAIYDALDRAQAAVVVEDPVALVRVLSLLFDDGAKLRLMQRHAVQTMDRLCGGTTRVMRAIEPHLVQMLVG